MGCDCALLGRAILGLRRLHHQGRFHAGDGHHVRWRRSQDEEVGAPIVTDGKVKAPHTGEGGGAEFAAYLLGRAAKFKELLFVAARVLATIVFGSDGLLGAGRIIRPGVRLWRAQDDLAIERERLQDDVKTFAILVHERGADVEPKVVLTFAFDDGVRLVGGLLSSHDQLLSLLICVGVGFSTHRRA